MTEGPWGLALLRPQHLFGLELSPLVHGVVWSLGAQPARSISACRCAARRRRSSGCRPTPSSRPSWRRWRRASACGAPSVTVEELTDDRRALSRRGAHALGLRQLRRHAPHQPRRPSDEADIRLVRYAEHILASAIGAASSRLVLSLLLRKRTVSTKAALKLLDDANAAIQYNREILQTALDHVRQGIAVFDKDLQLICWNRQFGEILDLPPIAGPRPGIGLADILRFNAAARRHAARARRRLRARADRALRQRPGAVPRAFRRPRHS